MAKDLQLTKSDIAKYRQEIKELDLSDKSEILEKALSKINTMINNPKLDQFQLILIQELSNLHNILIKTPHLEKSVQQKMVFALQYFLKGEDDIPDEIPGVGFFDDLVVIDWVIQEIKDQYSQYFQA